MVAAHQRLAEIGTSVATELDERGLIAGRRNVNVRTLVVCRTMTYSAIAQVLNRAGDSGQLTAHVAEKVVSEYTRNWCKECNLALFSVVKDNHEVIYAQFMDSGDDGLRQALTASIRKHPLTQIQLTPPSELPINSQPGKLTLPSPSMSSIRGTNVPLTSEEITNGLCLVKDVDVEAYRNYFQLLLRCIDVTNWKEVNAMWLQFRSDSNDPDETYSQNTEPAHIRKSKRIRTIVETILHSDVLYVVPAGQDRDGGESQAMEPCSSSADKP